MTVNLKKIIEVTQGELLSQKESDDVIFSAITANSREVEKGGIFVAIKGTSVDGHEFIDQVVSKKVALIIGEEKRGALSVPYLKVENSRKAISLISPYLFGNPASSLKIIGITGTSGKTTSTYILESILKATGEKVGVLGTINFRLGNELIEATHTTPDPLNLQKTLAWMVSKGASTVIMEVSSHALEQFRVDGITFVGTLFTNLSRDHLDYHSSMEEYYLSKKRLFTELHGTRFVSAISQSDEFGVRLLNELAEFKDSVSGFSLDDSELKMDATGISGNIGGVLVKSPLVGKFNAWNLAGVICLCLKMGVKSEAIEKGIEDLKVVPGRLERVGKSSIHVMVDYAHKPDALEKVIESIKSQLKENRLITVIGCGGDRDKGKREIMGKIAVKGSDHVFVTSDNPRTEDPMTILKEIEQGLDGFSNYELEVDRKRAIFKAIDFAREGDWVLIAGKGHEDYQIIADKTSITGVKKIHFDDREIALSALDKFSQQN